MELFKSKRGIFTNPFRNLSLASIFIFFILILVFTAIISYLLNQWFGTKLVLIGRPLQVLIVAVAIIFAFLLIVKRQGSYDRKDVVITLFVLGILAAAFYYLPKFLPEFFSNPAITQSTIYQASVAIHDAIQSVVPIP